MRRPEQLYKFHFNIEFINEQPFDSHGQDVEKAFK